MKESDKMVQMTPTKIFRKTALVTEIYKMVGVVIYFGIIGYFVYRAFN